VFELYFYVDGPYLLLFGLTVKLFSLSSLFHLGDYTLFLFVFDDNNYLPVDIKY